MKKLIMAIIALAIIGCNCGSAPAVDRRTGQKFYPIKICAIGGGDDTCVTYRAKKYNPGGPDLMFTTIDGHTYRFNHAGWAWVITVK